MVLIGLGVLVFLFFVYGPLCVSGNIAEDERNETQGS